MTRSCPNCSTVSSRTANFCSECGSALTLTHGFHPDGANGHPNSGVLRRLGPQQYIDTLIAGQHPIRSERRIVTTLFADVVNSTPMAEQLDPEDVTTIMNGAFGVLTEPIERHDGTLARLMGDAVLCLFGAPVAHEDDPLRACRAALEILECASEYDAVLQARYDLHFQVRVGITTGLVVVGEVGTDRRAEYTAMGDAVNLAARLQGKALPGSALIDEATFNQVRRVLDTEDLGRIALKGKSEPVQVYSLRDHGLGRVKSIPDGAKTPLVSRRQELEQLEEIIGNPSTDAGRVLFLSGDAGIGKTRLLQEVRAGVPESVTWIEGHCASHAVDMSYWAAQEVLQVLLGIDPFGASGAAVHAFRNAMAFASSPVSGNGNHPRTREELTAPLAHLLNVPMDDEESHFLSSLSAEQLRNCVVEAFSALVRYQSSVRRLVLVWEDMQWIDAQSLEIVESLCRTARDCPLILILVSRPAREQADDFQARIESECRDHIQELRLAPLSRKDCEEFVHQLPDTSRLPRNLLERVLTIAEGNAFCIEEMLRSFVNSDAAQDLDQLSSKTIAIDIAVPTPVQAAILARADRLSMQDRNVLQAAAVIGRVFHPDVLHLVIEPRISIDELNQSLDALEAGEFISRTSRGTADHSVSKSGGFASAVRLARPQALSTIGLSSSSAPMFVFRNAVVAEVIYKNLLKSERRQVHGRVGKVMEGLFRDRVNKLAPTLAYHYEKGKVGAKAVDYLLRTAEQAKTVSALDRAVDCCRRALALIDEANDPELNRIARPQLLEVLADVHYVRGEYPAAVRKYEDALCIETDTVRRAALMRKKGKLLGKRGQWEEARTCLVSALEEMKSQPDDTESAAIYTELSLVYGHQGQLAEAARIGQLALAIFQKTGNRSGEAQAYNNLGVITTGRGEWDQAEQFHTQGRTLYETIGNRFGLATSDNNLGCLKKERKCWEEALIHFRASLAQFERLGNQHAMARVYDNMSEVYYELGESERAQEYMEKAVTILAEIGSDSAGPIAEMWQSGTW